MWKDLSQLVASLDAFNAKQHGKPNQPLSLEEVQAFLAEEQTEAEV